MNPNEKAYTDGIEEEIASTNEAIAKAVPQLLPPFGLAVFLLFQLPFLNRSGFLLFQWLGLLVDGRGNEIGSILDELEGHEGMRGERLVIPQN